MTPVFVAVLVVYFGAVSALSWLGYRRTRTAADFIVAGRTLGAVVGGATLAASQISAGTFVGTVGLHYTAGVCFVWVWPGAWLGWVISSIFVAPRLRESGALTVPDYLGRRYGPSARTVSTLLIAAAYTVYLVAQFKAAGIIVHAVLGWPEWVGMVIVLASTVVYSLLGGLHGGARIDLLQGIVMILGVLAAVPYMLGHLGGFGGLAAGLHAIDPRLAGWFFGWRELVAFGAAFGLALSTTPLEITRFMSMRDTATARYAIGVAFVFQAAIGISIMLIGLSMRALFPMLASGDLASSVMAAHVLPPVAGSLLIVAAFSAIMGTTNAVLLVASACLVHDVYVPLVEPGAADRRVVAATRAAIVALAVVPLWFASHQLALVQYIVLFQAKLVASFFFAPVVIGLNWPRATPPAALTAMLAGLVTCVSWSLPPRPPLGIDAIFAGVACSVAAFVAVSVMTSHDVHRSAARV